MLRTIVENCDDSGPGSLRDAYFHAVDGEELDLTQLTCSRITLTTGALTDIAPNVGVFGPGSGAFTIDGNYANRVFVHNGNGALQLEGLTITHGNYSGDYGGGCIYSYGDVYLRDVTVTACSLRATSGSTYGGGIQVRHDATLIASTVSHSRILGHGDTFRGGGIASGHQFVAVYSTISDNTLICTDARYCLGGGLFTHGRTELDFSTVSGNVADYGGGIYHRPDTNDDPLLIMQSTISGNHANHGAGGVFATHTTLISDSTITANSSVLPAGGISFPLTRPTTMYGTIVANNTTESGAGADIAGSKPLVIGGSHNLVMDATVALPNDTLTDDPLLGPLQLNGGPTATHALPRGSPAIDRGINHAQFGEFLYDQRGAGYPRTIGADTDIGAFEASDTLFANGFDVQARRRARP
ncbi:MAG TPA: choice-of-anchor Q domain-containing protein [Rhodanobacteraceae bacterium]|nr:choice-of-anchor Q domain-containing protein [Rhodanobacteraceae bacterium]